MKTLTPEQAKLEILREISASELARAIGVTPQAVVQWKQFPADRILEIEAATNIGRDRLRPDLFEGYTRADQALTEGEALP